MSEMSEMSVLVNIALVQLFYENILSNNCPFLVARLVSRVLIIAQRLFIFFFQVPKKSIIKKDLKLNGYNDPF